MINSCSELNPDKIFVIIAHKAKEVRTQFRIGNIKFVIQDNQLGTGHAIQVLCDKIENKEGNLLVVNGDVPLIKSTTLKKLLKLHESQNADVSLITTKKKNPKGYEGFW